MSSMSIEESLPVKLAKALSNPLLPARDSQLCSGRHIGIKELDNHAFLIYFQEDLNGFYHH